MRIFDITMADGTPVSSVAEAVNKFMCPGPCSPDCPLYQAMRMTGNNYGHMCHPGVYAKHPANVLSAMGCSYSMDAANDDAAGTAQYAAVIKSSAVRDVQYCKNTDCDPLDDDGWIDLREAEIWLGFFSGSDALQKAADFADTDPENIRLIPVETKGANDDDSHA